MALNNSTFRADGQHERDMAKAGLLPMEGRPGCCQEVDKLKLICLEPRTVQCRRGSSSEEDPFERDEPMFYL